jgi:hypothetical protein
LEYDAKVLAGEGAKEAEKKSWRFWRS